jgi:glyoxylase I family protein
MKAIGLHHISIVVRDTSDALEFYCGVLGLPQNLERPALPFEGAWLDIGAQQIHLIERVDGVPARPASVPVSRDRHAAIYVDALEDLKERLTAAGIAFVLSRRRAALFCRDPDGNGLEFIVPSP